MASKRDRVKTLHKYSITPPAKAGDRWRTNFTGKDGRRVTLRARTEEELLNKLIPLYLADENIDKKTFHELFEEWILYKEQITSSPNTITKGVPIDFIREQLGHSSLSTTYGYIYNPLTEKETYEALTRALSSNPDPTDPSSENNYPEDTQNIIKIYENRDKIRLSPSCPHLSPKFRCSTAEPLAHVVVQLTKRTILYLLENVKGRILLLFMQLYIQFKK